MLSYRDPGAGSMILQALAGGIAGVAVVGKLSGRASSGYCGLVDVIRHRTSSRPHPRSWTLYA